jgi:ParB-like chromosome segregation protein Spo0J
MEHFMPQGKSSNAAQLENPTRRRAKEARQTGRKSRYKRICVKKILLKGDEELDEKVVADIAESIEVSDLFHPIAVRRVREPAESGEKSEKIVLVAGAHRLEAVKRLGREKISCFFVDGDDVDARLVRLGEDLWRKTLITLVHAERLVEYLSLASAKFDISGQVGQKSQFGRPHGGIALAARKLPALGRSVEARRKIIARAKKISQITPEAKQAAIEAHLENNQEALLRIAEFSGHKAQLRTVAELAEKTSSFSSASRGEGKGAVVANSLSNTELSKNQSAENNSRESDTDVDDAAEIELDAAPLDHTNTTFAEMDALWKSEQREAWASRSRVGNGSRHHSYGSSAVIDP